MAKAGVDGCEGNDVIPFNRPALVGNEFAYIQAAVESRQLSAAGAFSERCASWLERRIEPCRRALLTHSCTGALEMAAQLLSLAPGDEVIMPSFTFPTTAAAFALRGATPVFVDVRPDTLNIDERLIEAAITERTKAIVVVHYAGVAAEMDAIVEIARANDLFVVEDAAQALLASYRGRSCGGLGDLAALSFHETKNVIAGEGGAILFSGDEWVERGYVLRDKGTNRQQFFRGEVDRYSWVDLGSSYGLSELGAAFLWAQLEQADRLVEERLRLWAAYHEGLEGLESKGLLARPTVLEHVVHNAHLYYVLLPNLAERTRVLRELNERDINAVFHFVPLHSSEAGRRFGRTHGELSVTDAISERLLRLPLWVGMTDRDIERVLTTVHEVVEPAASATIAPEAHEQQ